MPYQDRKYLNYYANCLIQQILHYFSHESHTVYIYFKVLYIIMNFFTDTVVYWFNF